MLDLDWKDIDAYERADYKEGVEQIQISGIIAKNYRSTDPIPANVLALAGQLEGVVQEAFPEHSVIGVQSPQEPNPRATNYRYVAFIDIEQKGQMYGGITLICNQGEHRRGYGETELSLILPLGELASSSRKVIEAAWPYIGELHHTDEGDNRYIFRAKGRKVLAAGHDVLKEIGAKLPEKPVYMLT